MSLEITPLPITKTDKLINWIASAKKFAPAKDLAVFPLDTEGSVGLGYDWDFLYVQVNVPFAVHPVGSRSWRSGDGFLLTVSPNINASQEFLSLGFGGSSKDPQAVLVNNCGRWFPVAATNEIRYLISSLKGETEYKAAIPWSLLAPIRPLPIGGIGLNLSFIGNYQGNKVISQLVPDQMYDTEDTNLRQVMALAFAPHPWQRAKAQTVLTQSRWLGDKPLQLNLGVYSPVSAPAELTVSIRSQEIELEKYCFAMELAPGIHRWIVRWSPHRALAPGLYNLQVRGKGGHKDYLKNHSFLVLDLKDLSSLGSALEAMENDVKFLHQDAVHTALAQLQWLSNYGQTPPWEVTDKPLQVLAEIQRMLDALRVGENPLAEVKGLNRRAFRSKLDGSLQPYSIYLPKAYSPNKRWPALVLLHGSGVDDAQFSANPDIHRLSERMGMVIILPLGRDKSGWYLDQCETDIFEALSATKSSLSLDWSRIFLAGFSMGGFGTWHTGLRHPRQFAGLAVLSGLPSLPKGLPHKPQYTFTPSNYAEAACSLPILVVHGAQDDAVPIEPTRQVVQQLKETGAELTWRELPKAGHGDYDWVSELSSWLKLQLKK
jgi:predicted esterase